MDRLLEQANRLIKEQFNNEQSKLPISIKMLLQDALLTALVESKDFDIVSFHGGTSLQRVYYSPRLSEDLDFSCPDKDKFSNIFAGFDSKIKLTLEKYGISNFSLTEPKELDNVTLGSTKTWKINIQKPVPQMVKIDLELGKEYLPSEFAMYRTISNNFTDLQIKVKSKEEILLNKVFAILFRSRLQYRDIFDLYYLNSLNTTLNKDKLLEKCLDKAKDLSVIEQKILELNTNFIDNCSQELSRFFSKNSPYLGEKMLKNYNKTGLNILSSINYDLAKSNDINMGML